jgi:hypothetical protein
LRIRAGFQLNPPEQGDQGGQGNGSQSNNNADSNNNDDNNKEVIIIETTIRLTFRTVDAKAVIVSIPRANPAVTGTEVRTAMDRILAADVIATKAGIPVTVDKAELIDIEELVYTV